MALRGNLAPITDVVLLNLCISSPFEGTISKYGAYVYRSVTELRVYYYQKGVMAYGTGQATSRVARSVQAADYRDGTR
jgi:hypothetical protein